jgi:chromosome segregation ATPase
MIEQDELNNTSQVTVLSTRLYYPEKAQFITKSDEHGNKMAAQLAELVRAFNNDKLAKERYESESNLHKKATQDTEKIRNERDELKKKFEDIKKEKDRLSKKVTELDKKVEAETQKSQKTDTDKDKQIEKLRNELSQVKGSLNDKESKRKSLASKHEELEQRLKQANNYISEITGGMLGPERKQF